MLVMSRLDNKANVQIDEYKMFLIVGPLGEYRWHEFNIKPIPG